MRGLIETYLILAGSDFMRDCFGGTSTPLVRDFIPPTNDKVHYGQLRIRMKINQRNGIHTVYQIII